LVLATIGGGDDGHSVLEAFVEAAHRGQWNGMVVVGPLAADDKRNHIRELATKRGVRFYDFLPNLSDWFARVDALVCMGGYNTLGEALSVGTPIVCVPRTAPRQEQLMRARALARLGLLRVLNPNRLDVSTLRLAVEKSVKTSRCVLLRKVNAVLNFDGAFRAARSLLEIAAGAGIQEDSIRRVANWGSSGFKMDNNEPVTPATPVFPSINSGQTLRLSEGDLGSLPDTPLQSPLTVAQANGLAARSKHSKS
jgi:predicted glycosyltransferase